MDFYIKGILKDIPISKYKSRLAQELSDHLEDEQVDFMLNKKMTKKEASKKIKENIGTKEGIVGSYKTFLRQRLKGWFWFELMYWSIFFIAFNAPLILGYYHSGFLMERTFFIALIMVSSSFFLKYFTSRLSIYFDEDGVRKVSLGLISVNFIIFSFIKSLQVIPFWGRNDDSSYRLRELSSWEVYLSLCCWVGAIISYILIMNWLSKKFISLSFKPWRSLVLKVVFFICLIFAYDFRYNNNPSIIISSPVLLAFTVTGVVFLISLVPVYYLSKCLSPESNFFKMGKFPLKFKYNKDWSRKVGLVRIINPFFIYIIAAVGSLYFLLTSMFYNPMSDSFLFGFRREFERSFFSPFVNWIGSNLNEYPFITWNVVSYVLIGLLIIFLFGVIFALRIKSKYPKTLFFAFNILIFSYISSLFLVNYPRTDNDYIVYAESSELISVIDSENLGVFRNVIHYLRTIDGWGTENSIGVENGNWIVQNYTFSREYEIQQDLQNPLGKGSKYRSSNYYEEGVFRRAQINSWLCREDMLDDDFPEDQKRCEEDKTRLPKLIEESPLKNFNCIREGKRMDVLNNDWSDGGCDTIEYKGEKIIEGHRRDDYDGLDIYDLYMSDDERWMLVNMGGYMMFEQILLIDLNTLEE